MQRLLPYFERLSEGTWRCVRPVTVAEHGRVFHVAPKDIFTLGQCRRGFDIAFELEYAFEHFWRPRDFEAHMLVDLLRLSRLTLLYGAQGVGKTTLLKMGVLPLLRRGAERRAIAQGDKPRAVVPFSDRRATDAAPPRPAEIAVIFDRWADVPLAALHASIVDMLPVKCAGAAEPENLSGNVAAWNREHGLRVFIILDCFEQYLRAPQDRPGIADFEYEFVRMINQPDLAAHFLLSLRDDAEPLLNRFKERINGLGDAFLRLPDWHRAAVPLIAPHSQAHQPIEMAMLHLAAWETPAMAPGEPSMAPLTRNASRTTEGKTESSELSRDLVEPSDSAMLNEGATNRFPTADRPANVLHDSLASATETWLGPKHAPTGESEFQADAPQPREIRRISASILLAAGVAGFGVVLAAVFLTIGGHHNASTSRLSVITGGPAAEIGAAIDRADPSVQADSPAARRDIPIPLATADIEPQGGSAAASVRAHPTTPRASAARRMPRSESLEVAANAAIDWKTEMLHELEACRAESFFSRIACVEQARWKHCAPDRWNTIPECEAGIPRATLAD